MTLFDEIQNEIDLGIEDIGFPTEGYHHIMKASEMFDKLREEYAPTVEMTKEQVDELNSIIREVGEVFEQNEIPADVKLTDKVIGLESSYILFKYLNAILHPETIKIIDEDIANDSKRTNS